MVNFFPSSGIGINFERCRLMNKPLANPAFRRETSTMTMKRAPLLSSIARATGLLILLGIVPSNVAAERGDRADKAVESANRAAERAARDGARAAENAARVTERARIDDVKARETAQIREAKADTDQTKAEMDAKIDAIKADADAEEKTAKESADAAEQAAKAAEDAAKDAADAFEDAARAAEERLDDSLGSSEGMRDLASEENPDFDDKGFPVRRGEIVGIDVDERSLARATSAGFTIIERAKLPSIGSEIVRLEAPKGMNSKTALEFMRRSDGAGSYDLAHYYGLLFAPQGGSKNNGGGTIKARPDGLKIGMIDTGVAAHKVFAKTKLQARSFAGAGKAVPTEHGTAIASLLASGGASTIVVANIFEGTGSKPYTSADAIVRALDWMVQQQVAVINISLAGPRNRILDALVRKASGMGYVIVAAAGNGGPGAPPAYPAALPEVVAVTAVDENKRIYRYANQGEYIRVAAMGVDVVAAAPGGATVRQSGTSFATPHIAVWMARCTNRKGFAARPACIKRLESEARDLGAPGRDPVYGFGIVQ